MTDAEKPVRTLNPQPMNSAGIGPKRESNVRRIAADKIKKNRL